MTGFVLDVSVAAKWFLPAEHEAGEALALLGRYADGQIELHVPDLFWPEVGNVLRKAARSGRISTGTARESIATLSELRLNTSASGPLLPYAFEISVSYGTAVYDGIYVALAVFSNRTLVTADERLANALAARFPVRLLGAL